MKTALLFIIFVLSAATFGQEPDQWRGLVLDKATPEQAKQLLGAPKSEKTSDKMMAYRNKSLREAGDMVILHWEKVEGFEDVKLYFIAGTLAIIQLEKPKEKIPAKVFVDAYPGVGFAVASRYNSSAYYEVEATTPTSKNKRRDRECDRKRDGGMFGNIGKAGKLDRLEGNVILILIQSRRVDDKRGVDALK
jgi:hypothetical protein